MATKKTLSLTEIRAAVVKAFGQREAAAKTVREGLRAMFPSQDALKQYGFKAYSEFRDDCKASALKGGLAEKSWDKTWQRALFGASLKPIGADGNPTTKGGTGESNKRRATASKGTDNPSKPADLTDDAAITHLFGHCDEQLKVAVKVAAANEQAFLRFAALIVESANKAKDKKAA